MAVQQGPSRSGRPRRPGVSERVLEACFAELTEGGYARMSMASVARRAGVTRPTVYRRWATKEELAVACLAHAQSGIDQLPVTGDVRRDLLAHLRSLQQTLTRPNGMSVIGTMLAEEATTPSLITGFRRDVIGPRRAPIRAILGRLGVSAAEREALLDLVVGGCYARYMGGDGFPERWAETVVDLVMSAGSAGGQGGRTGDRDTPSGDG